MRAHDLGRLGEEIACRYLQEQGCRILARNLVFSGGEIDVVAQRASELLFVEVKTRTKGNLAEGDYLPEAKIARLNKAIHGYLAQYPCEDWQPLLICVELDQGKAGVREVPL